MPVWRHASWGMSFVCATTLCVSANASPGWSSQPRWQLPSPRATCPHGWEMGERRLARRDRVRCAQAAQPAQHPHGAHHPNHPNQPDQGVAAIPNRTDSVPDPHDAQQPRAPAWRPNGPEPRAAAPAVSWPDASAIAALDAPACHGYLNRHGVAFEPSSSTQVAQPIRLTGPIQDVTFVIPWSKDRGSDPHAIWDCRLAAAMIPLANWLSTQGVREVHYFSVLRKGAMARARPRSQHNIGLAIDILGVVVQGESTRWNVEDHYPVGSLTGCPPSEPPSRRLGAAARLWTSLVCHAASGAWLHTILTPDHDHAHRNHLHLDLDLRQTAPADPFVSFAPGVASTN
jgi:hypothetical protein